MMAFAVTNEEQDPLYDPAYVEWSARLKITKNGNSTFHEIDIHPCTKSDLP